MGQRLLRGLRGTCPNPYTARRHRELDRPGPCGRHTRLRRISARCRGVSPTRLRPSSAVIDGYGSGASQRPEVAFLAGGFRYALKGRELCSVSLERAVPPVRTALTARADALPSPSAIKRGAAAEASTRPPLVLAGIQKSFLGHETLYGYLAASS